MNLKVFIPIFFVGLVAALARDFAAVKNAGIEGAIIPLETVQEWHDSIRRGRGAPHGIQNMLGVEAESFWTPQAKDVELTESRLRTALEKEAKDSPQVQQILKHYNEYRRQYIGLVIHGRRHIYLNSFSSRDSLPNYAKQFVMVSDGGFWFWHILYSVEDGTFLNLSINGEA